MEWPATSFCRLAIPISFIRVVIFYNKTVLVLENDVCNVVDLVLSAMFNINGDYINFDIRKLYADTGMINSNKWCVLKSVTRQCVLLCKWQFRLTEWNRSVECHRFCAHKCLLYGHGLIFLVLKGYQTGYFVK